MKNVVRADKKKAEFGAVFYTDYPANWQRHFARIESLPKQKKRISISRLAELVSA